MFHKKLTRKKWLIVVALLCMILMLVMTGMMYIIDPFFQYHVKDHQYMLNTKYVSPGLIKNYDYDSIMIGSSMTQNFDMEDFAEQMDCKPLLIGSGGINLQEMVEYIELAQSQGKASDYYICADLYLFAQENDSTNIQYLFEDSALSTIKYVLSFEAWFRFMPVDVALTTAKKLGITLPTTFEKKMSISSYQYWGDEEIYGEDIVIERYKNGRYSISDVDTENLYQRMVEQIDLLFENLDSSNENIYFFFPPYSALYWCEVQDKGYFEQYLMAKEYFVQKAMADGCIVYDFQSEELIQDLNNYKDYTHYSPQINSWMTKCFSEGKNIVTEDNILEYHARLREKIDSFRKNKYEEL